MFGLIFVIIIIIIFFIHIYNKDTKYNNSVPTSKPITSYEQMLKDREKRIYELAPQYMQSNLLKLVVQKFNSFNFNINNIAEITFSIADITITGDSYQFIETIDYREFGYAWLKPDENLPAFSIAFMDATHLRSRFRYSDSWYHELGVNITVYKIPAPLMNPLEQH